MSNKADLLKKRLIRDAAIAFVVLILLAGAGYEASNYDDQSQSDKQHVEDENNKIHTDTESIQALINNGSEVSTFYAEYIKNHNDNFLLDRELVTGLLAILREKNHLVNMSVTVAPITDAAAGTLALKASHIIQSEIKLSFKAITDNSVYGFIEDMQRKLPGIVVIHELKITKNNELTGDVLRSLSAHRIDALVSVELSFYWLGMRENADEKTNAGAAPPSQHMPSFMRRPQNGQ